MPRRRSLSIRACLLVLSCFSSTPLAYAQGAKQTVSGMPIASADHDHVKEGSAWFLRGRVVAARPSAELRRRAYEQKMQPRSQRNTAATALLPRSSGRPSPSSAAGFWIPLGPVPLASDASGSGLQDYHQVSGRAPAVAIDPADASGNTVYIGGAQGGVWKSANAASLDASIVTWIPVADDQATLSVGSVAIQPGNVDPTKSVILVGTGEANNSADSYFGLGILRSSDAGNTWTLIPTANNGSLSFGGMGGTRMAFSTVNTKTVVSAMATTSEGVVEGSVTSNTMRGLYTSTDAGITWTYDALLDPGNQPTDPTSSTSVAYNAKAGIFFGAIRYHGFYSSPDGTHWTRLANQPGGGVLNTIACPPQSTSNSQACPIYRAEIAGVPGRNEMAEAVAVDTNPRSIRSLSAESPVRSVITQPWTLWSRTDKSRTDENAPRPVSSSVTLKSRMASRYRIASRAFTIRLYFA